MARTTFITLALPFVSQIVTFIQRRTTRARITATADNCDVQSRT